MQQHEKQSVPILLADDNEPNRTLIGRMLKKLRYTNVTTAGDGNEVLLKFKDNTYAVALLDIEMPGHTGFEIAKKIKVEADYAHLSDLKIIALTGHEGDSICGDLDSSGIKHCLSKPIRMAGLGELLESVIG